ncbi:MAG TPA: IclR family transcriptional regulator [Nocardioidaceae bacterium]|nr:IclR family transcriptional regulator [Nocardioidaceae bacterium]
MSSAPASTRTLRILRFLAAQPQPVAAEHIASAVGLPRASTYRLLTAMADEGFVVHLADEQTFGLGPAAFEVGAGYVRQAPLERLSRLPLARLVDRVGESAHLAVLHGRDVLYVIEERAPGRPPLVTDVGVRLPSQLTASGRAILAALPAAQVRALFPGRAAFGDHAGPATAAGRASVRPTTPAALRVLLSETRQRGYAVEDGEVTPGFASVASAVLDHNGYPTAAVAVTFDSRTAPGPGRRSGPSAYERLAPAVGAVAAELSRRLRGRGTHV